MKEEMDRAQAELDALKRTEEDLKKGHQKLEEMVSRLDQEVVRAYKKCFVCLATHYNIKMTFDLILNITFASGYTFAIRMHSWCYTQGCIFFILLFN